jgi:inosine/xanthosine triphosphate pyrophosphatase family protein/shikimate kinase
MDRLEIRDAFLRLPRQLSISFYTSSRAKFSQASTIFQMSGARLTYRSQDEDPYYEDYTGTKESLLAGAIQEIRHRAGDASPFFIEDTSIKIDALSQYGDYPGLRAKEWFAKTSFENLLANVDEIGNRRCSVESCIGLALPGLVRPLFFYGETAGELVSSVPRASMNLNTPWLDPDSFSAWFTPDGANRTLAQMSFEESITYDFRSKSLLALIDRLEELTIILNVGPAAYRRREYDFSSDVGKSQEALFDIDPVSSHAPALLLVVGPTCAGKTTFGMQAMNDTDTTFVDASSLVRKRRSEADTAQSLGDFALDLLEEEGYDMVARAIADSYLPLTRSLVVTGLRTIEEIELLRQLVPDLRLVSLRTPQKVRYERFIRRASREPLTYTEFQRRDIQQASLGLLPVADELADLILENVGRMEDFIAQIRWIIGVPGGSSRDVTQVGKRMPLASSQLYRSLIILRGAGRALTTQEISSALKYKILHNNVNKMLRRYPQLARRRESPGSKVRYEITSHGLAFLSAIERLNSTHMSLSGRSDA